MADRIQQRRDTAARWAQFNPILLEGEVGYVLDKPNQYKIGDGVKAWNDLPLRGYDGTLTDELGTDDTSAMTQSGVTKSFQKYLGVPVYTSSAELTKEFADSILNIKAVPKFEPEDGVTYGSLRLATWTTSVVNGRTRLTIVGGIMAAVGGGTWYKTINFTAYADELIDDKFVLLKNVPNSDWGQCYIVGEAAKFPTGIPSGTYPTIVCPADAVYLPNHPILDFYIRQAIDRPDIDALLFAINNNCFVTERSTYAANTITFNDSPYKRKYIADSGGYCSYTPVKKGDKVGFIMTPFVKYDETQAFPDTTFIQVMFGTSIVPPTTTDGVTFIVPRRNLTADDYKYGQVTLNVASEFTVPEDGYVMAFVTVGDRTNILGNVSMNYLNFGTTAGNVDANKMNWYRQTLAATDPVFPSWSMFGMGGSPAYQNQIPLVLYRKNALLAKLLENVANQTNDRTDINDLKLYLSRDFKISADPSLKEFTDTVIECYAVAKFDISAYDGRLRMNGWNDVTKAINCGIMSSRSWVRTTSIQKTDITIGGMTLWYINDVNFEIALLADESKFPIVTGNPSFQVALNTTSLPVHPTIWAALNLQKINDIEKVMVVNSVDYLTTPYYGYQPSLPAAAYYNGDNAGICQYVRLTQKANVTKLITQFFKTNTLRSGMKLMVGIFNSLTNPTTNGAAFTLVNRDLVDADFDVNNQLIIPIEQQYIESGKIIQVVIFTGALSTVNSGVKMKYLNFGTTAPEHTEELSSWYRQSSAPTEAKPIPDTWSLFSNTGIYAYQYQMPVQVADDSVLSKIDERLSEVEDNYLPKTTTVQQADVNEKYGSYYNTAKWAILQDIGCRVMYAQARKTMEFTKILTTFCKPSNANANKACKLRVFAKIGNVTNADLRATEGFLYEMDINPYLDLPEQSSKTFFVINLTEPISVEAGQVISVVLFDPDTTKDGTTGNTLASIASWVFKGDNVDYRTLQQVYRNSSYNYTTQTFSLRYFTYANMVTYSNYIGNIEPIFSIEGESGENLRKDIDSNTERIESLEEAGSIAKFYSRSILPSILHAAVGLEFNLYFDGFNLLPDYGKGEPTWMFNIQSEVESSWRGLHYRSYRRTMQAGDVGNHTLTIDYYNNRNQKYSTVAPDERFQTALKVVANTNPAAQKRMCIIGDSTNENGNVAKRMYENFQAASGGIAPIMLGTRNDATKTWHHEARTEKTYSMFANGETVIRIDFQIPEGFTKDDIVTANPSPTYNIGGQNVIMRHLWHLNDDGTGYAIGYNNSSVNLGWTGVATKVSGAASMPASVTVTQVSRPTGWSPFKNNEGVGTLDFGYYRTVILGLAANEKIDLMFSDLGINDIYTGGKSEADINNIVNNAKKLIDAFIADGNGVWAVCYPKSRSSAIATSDRRHYPMRIDMQSLREALVNTFDNGAYNENVIICGSGMQLDRWYGYPMATNNVAARIPIEETKPTEGVHPSDPGYQQVGDAMTATAWAVLQ